MRIGREELRNFQKALEERELSRATVSKYLRDVGALCRFCGGTIRDKDELIRFKEYLQQEGYAPASVNSMLVAVNTFLCFMECPAWRLRLLKVQRSASFVDGGRLLDQREYERLVRGARQAGDERLALLMETICSAGLRVSEVRAVTVESLRRGYAEIRNKGKIRLIPLPPGLCRLLERYCRERSIRRGCVFVTRTGRPLDRSNIWKMMKRLAQKVGVGLRKTFPHNLRRLFAVTYYRKYRDIVHLADILGHSSLNTARMYTARSPREQRRRMDCLCLLL